MRPIDADALTNAHIECPEHISFFDFGEMVEMFLQTVDEQPTVDAVQVVRCDECEYWGAYTDNGKPNGMGHCGHPNILMPTSENFFCGFGKRKEKENESND